ncbi:MAG: tetratricopeptide repeat protein, partial [Pseudomonadales bacterium]|nr:tetratricopeptide repeat protein [Pseudomonadales bacterium]
MARLTVLFIVLFSFGCAVKAQLPAERESRATPKRSGLFEPTNTAGSDLISDAREMIAENNAEDAIVLLERALRLDPQNGHTWLVLAEAELSR